MTPKRYKPRPGKAAVQRRSEAHKQWVRGHECVVPGCALRGCEAAHVRLGTGAEQDGGGLGMKPADRWVIPLCTVHHRQQHRIGERTFAKWYGIDMKAIAEDLARRSPHLKRLARELGQHG